MRLKILICMAYIVETTVAANSRYLAKCTFLFTIGEHFDYFTYMFDYFPMVRKATITLCDLSAEIQFKLAHSCLNAFNLAQSYIVNSKESAIQIAPSKSIVTMVSCPQNSVLVD